MLINIGYGNFISAERIIAAVSHEAAPIKRMAQDARENGILIDATCGRKTKSVLFIDSGQVVLSALPPETLANRVNGKNDDTNGRYTERSGKIEE